MKKETKPEFTDEGSSIPKPVDSILQYHSTNRVITHGNPKITHLTEGNVITARDRILSRNCTGTFTQKPDTCNLGIERILSLIIEPRIISLGKELFIQDVSSCPGKSLDMIHLQEKLNQELKLKGAQSTGICSIRRKLFGELFKEIIRQVTIECTERGLLLSRVNSELNLSLAKIRQIYESNVAYGMNKTLRGQRNRTHYSKTNESLLNEIEELKVRLVEANANVDAVQEREMQKLITLRKKFEIDFIFMKKNYDQLKQQLVEAIELIKHPEAG